METVFAALGALIAVLLSSSFFLLALFAWNSSRAFKRGASEICSLLAYSIDDPDMKAFLRAVPAIIHEHREEPVSVTRRRISELWESSPVSY